MLIFDNCLELEAIKQFLPRFGNGAVIITSQNKAWQGMATQIEIPHFQRDEAISYLSNGLAVDDETMDRRIAIEQLAEELDFLPLSLAYARAYIGSTKVDFSEYLKRIKSRKLQYISRGFKLHDYSHSVESAWDNAIDAALSEHGGAAFIFGLLSFYSAELIPRNLLNRRSDVYPVELQDFDEREKAIAALHRFSLIDLDTDYISVHRLVQSICSIPDDHIDPRRSAFFMARSVLRDILSGVRTC